MSNSTSTDDEKPETWEEPREQAHIKGMKRTIPNQQRREIDRRREGN